MDICDLEAYPKGYWISQITYIHMGIFDIQYQLQQYGILYACYMPHPGDINHPAFTGAYWTWGVWDIQHHILMTIGHSIPTTSIREYIVYPISPMEIWDIRYSISFMSMVSFKFDHFSIKNLSNNGLPDLHAGFLSNSINSHLRSHQIMNSRAPGLRV